MSVLRPAGFAGRKAWEILSDITRQYAREDIKVARVLIMVTKYIKELEESPLSGDAGKLDVIRDELLDIVERLDNSEVMENLRTALQLATEQKEAITAEFLRDAEKLQEVEAKYKAVMETYPPESDAIAELEKLRTENSKLLGEYAELSTEYNELQDKRSELMSTVALYEGVEAELTANIEAKYILKESLDEANTKLEATEIELEARNAKYKKLYAAYKKLKGE